MTKHEPYVDGTTVTECIAKIADLIATLSSYSPDVLAAGMGANLQCVLRSILKNDLSARPLIDEFLELLTRNVLKPDQLDSTQTPQIVDASDHSNMERDALRWLRILNVGEGDRTFKFDPNNPEECERAKIAITEMLRLGFGIFVRDGERDGEPLYSRVTGFDPQRNEYIIVGAPEAPGQDSTQKERKGRTPPPGKKKARRMPADDTSAVAVAPSAGGMSDRKDSVEARNQELATKISIADVREALRNVAAERNDWAGIPMPLPDFPLVIEPRYPYAEGLDTLDQGNDLPNNIPAGFTLRNCFYSHRARRYVWVWASAGEDIYSEEIDPKYTADKDGQFDGRIDWGLRGDLHHFKIDVGAMYVSNVWGIEQEIKAQETLRELLTEDAFDRYVMTGMFVEQSSRSGIYYFFRRLRPTVAVSNRDGDLKILAALCAHPIAYYTGTWAGAMCPTDDVIAHLMMMRGDEAFYWRRCNQHQASHPEAGL